MFVCVCKVCAMRKKRVPLKYDRMSQDRFKRCMIFYGALLLFMLLFFVTFMCAVSGQSSLIKLSRSNLSSHRLIRSWEAFPVSFCHARALQHWTPGRCLETMRGAKLIPPPIALRKRCV